MTDPFGLHWLAPDGLFGLGDWNRLGRAVMVSLVANIAVMQAVAGSRYGRAARAISVGDVGVTELRALATRFLPLGACRAPVRCGAAVRAIGQPAGGRGRA